ncbi:hypothetical protein POBR111598_09990 [Polynucleobacter brandtiae]
MVWVALPPAPLPVLSILASVIAPPSEVMDRSAPDNNSAPVIEIPALPVAIKLPAKTVEAEVSKLTELLNVIALGILIFPL